MKHKGLSGFGLRIKDDTIEKWTVGQESKLKLYESYLLQKNEHYLQNLLPIQPLPIFFSLDSFDSFSFIMPYHLGDTGFTAEENININAAIRSSLIDRSYQYADGFKKIIKIEISKYKKSVLTKIIEDKLESVDDLYPLGFCHGDFGFANMLIDGDSISMIDFTPSFIYSPLMDIATMELSLFSSVAKPWHFKLFEDIERDHERFKEQKNIVRMCKVLSFTHSEDNEDFKKDLMQKFYGISDGSTNI